MKLLRNLRNLASMALLATAGLAVMPAAAAPGDKKPGADPALTPNNGQAPPAAGETTPPPEDVAAIRKALEDAQAEHQAALAALEAAARDNAAKAAAAEARATAAEAQAAAAQAKAEQVEAAKIADVEAAKAQVKTLTTNYDTAVATVRALTIAANPDVPEDMVSGKTIEEITASLARARQVVEKVRASLDAGIKNGRIPPGAPARTGPDLDGLTATEKIKAGLKHK